MKNPAAGGGARLTNFMRSGIDGGNTTAGSIAQAFSGSIRNGNGFLCRCPVAMHGKGRGDRNPSLSIADGDDGKLLVRCFAGCDSLDVLAELRRRGLLEASGADNPPRRFGRPADAGPSPPKPEPEPDERALELWCKAIPASGTLAEQYLRVRRITLPIPPSIRFLPYVDYMPRIGFPAMVAAVQRPDRGIIAVQVTFLDPSGERKAQLANPRKTIGKLGTGAVRLGPADDSLGLAEGVETALSAMQLSGIPVWACLGSARMDSVTIPSHVRFLEVFADNDAPGQEAAKKTLERHRAECGVRGHLPPAGFGDWNDHLRAKELAQC